MDKERAGIQSVEVGFALLEALTRSHGPLMLKDIAAAAGMSAAKAHRYLVSYQRLGLVVQDTRSSRYDLGPAALKLGLASLSRLDAIRLARELVPQLMEQIGHTIALAVWGNRGATLVHWEESSRQGITANLRLGDVMPLMNRLGCNTAACHGSAKGKGGLSLSMFGADPQSDYEALTKADGGRQQNAGHVPHWSVPPLRMFTHKIPCVKFLSCNMRIIVKRQNY